MAWQPQPDNLAQLSQFLRDSLSGHDRNAQKSAESMLEQAKTSPDINNYLTFLTVTSTNPTSLNRESWHGARTAAAMMLKNDLKQRYPSIPEPSRQYIKANILQGLQDQSPQIRNLAGNVVTELVKRGGIMAWSQVLQNLVSISSNESGQVSSDAQDGAMSALFKICEDNKSILDREYQNQRPLAFLLPKLLAFTTSTEARIRMRALSSINVFLTQPISLSAQEHIDQILERVVQLTTDQNEEVRRFVCRSFALMADGMPEVLLPHIEGVVQYTLSQQKDSENQELALDAAEFFFEASNNAKLRDALGPFLPKVVPTLLDCMVYSEEDQLRLEGDQDDANEEDEEKEIRPHFAASKASRVGAEESTLTAGTNGHSRPAANGYAYEEDDELSDGEIDEENENDVDPEDEWNLRKCSAAALDSIASHFGAPVFSVTLPWLTENLQHKDWQNREAAVLALGAVGPGCMADISPHLPNLVPYLISLLNDEQPVVRQITCWALSRFADWASHLDAAGKQSFFEPMMEGILQRMLDKNKNVQESAASAFATLEEKANTQLVPYCQVIVQQFVHCFDCYQARNMYILYDCVQTLAEHAGPALSQPELVDTLMPALIKRWQKVEDGSREMFPLLECLAFVATSLENLFAPFAQPFFMRCIRIIDDNLTQGEYPEIDAPDKDFLVTSLDLLSAIIQALDKQQSMELVGTAKPDMYQLLERCMQDANNDVRQSAYALLGDCAIYIFRQLQPWLPKLMGQVIAQLDLSQAEMDQETAFRVINNACWSCGEIAMRQGAGMAAYIDLLLPKLAMIMMSNDAVPESLKENAAIALGRLGMGCHSQLAPHLAGFAGPFLRAMQKVRWTDEKGHAYRGFSMVVLDHPQALESVLIDFFVEMGNAPAVFLTGMRDEGPRESFERVLAEYKRLLGDNWEGFLKRLPGPSEQALKQLYAF